MATHDLDTFPATRPGRVLRMRQRWAGQRFQRRLQITLGTLVIFAGAILMLTPFAWMLSTSLKAEGDVFLIPIRWIPPHFIWSNYPNALTFVPYVRYFSNSVLV